MARLAVRETVRLAGRVERARVARAVRSARDVRPTGYQPFNVKVTPRSPTVIREPGGLPARRQFTAIGTDALRAVRTGGGG